MTVFRGSAVSGSDVAGIFLRWMAMRAACHRGYVLVSGLYFVVEADLSASDLVLLGATMSAVLLVSDIPTGVISDAASRRRSLLIGHGLLAAGMVLTGVVTAYPLILVTQVLWGLGWGFISGADVAWVTDELDQPERIGRVLAASARWDLLGGVVGMIGFGVLGWVVGLGGAIVMSGIGMGLVGIYVASRFVEVKFVPVKEQRWNTSRSIFRRGVELARRDREIRLMLAATMMLNGAGIVSWLFPKQLIEGGFPKESVLWYTTLGIAAYLVGAMALRAVEARIDSPGVAGWIYGLACAVGALGLVMLALAANAVVGAAGVLLVSGIGFTVTRTVSVIWVNRRAESEVRATLHSFLSQAECVGEVVGGIALAALAGAAGGSSALLTAAGLIGLVGVVVGRRRGKAGML